MDAPTIIVGLIILALCLAIVGRGIYNRTRRRGDSCGCGGGCGGCPNSGLCHPTKS